MIGVDVHYFVHLVVDLVQQGKWESIFGRFFSRSIATKLSTGLMVMMIHWQVSCVFFPLLHSCMLSRIALEVEIDFISFVTVALVVMNYATSIASKEELIVFAESNAGDSRKVIIDRHHGS